MSRRDADGAASKPSGVRGVRLALLVLGGLAIAYAAIAVFERLAPRRVVRGYQKFVGNPLQRPSAGIVPGWAVIETVGRRTGLPRQIPVGGRQHGDSYWFVAGDARQSAYVRNIEAEPRVRVRVHGRWRSGMAHLLPGDNPRRRLLRLNPVNSLFILIANRGAGLLTIRVDLEPRS
jgi:deazaflavin-dependent oxidoreductase (nitroreductase family)